MKTQKLLIVTRHEGAAEFVRQTEGFSHLHQVTVGHWTDDIMASVRRDATAGNAPVVVGVLPISLAAQICAATGQPVGALSLPEIPAGKRGQELTPAEMRAYGARITWVNVVGADAPGSVGRRCQCGSGHAAPCGADDFCG